MDHEIDFSFCKPYLIPGEHILWRGNPGKGNLLTKNDIFTIPFSIFWTGGVSYIAYEILTSDSPLFAKLFLIPFLCAGFFLLIGRFLVLAFNRGRTAYVLTNLKVIRKQGNRVDTLALANAPATHLEMFRNGNGTITFGDPSFRMNQSRKTRYDGTPDLFALENIPDPVRVQGLILNAQQ